MFTSLHQAVWVPLLSSIWVLRTRSSRGRVLEGFDHDLSSPRSPVFVTSSSNSRRVMVRRRICQVHDRRAYSFRSVHPRQRCIKLCCEHEVGPRLFLSIHPPAYPLQRKQQPEHHGSHPKGCKRLCDRLCRCGEATAGREPHQD